MWNDGEGLSVTTKKILIYIGSIILTVALFFITYNYILPKGKDPNSPANIENYIASVAIILTIIGYILKITDDLLSRQVEASIALSVEVATDENYAIITSSIENKGIKSITNMQFFLFIDQPVLEQNSGLYKINHVLKHECPKEYNCRFSKVCKEKKISSYPQEFRLKEPNNLYYGFKKLDFLSPESVLYVNPGERFSEDVVFRLKSGVYRVLLIGMHGKNLKYCTCANKQFIIH